MAKDMYEQWNETVDVKGLAEEVKELEKNGDAPTYKDVEPGDYEVAVEQMELKKSNSGKQMVSIWFKIVSEGEFKNNRIFYNQVVDQAYGVHNANKMLRSLVSECADAPEIEFEDYVQYKNLVLDVFEAIDGNYEYALTYGVNNKGYNTFEVTEVFILE